MTSTLLRIIEQVRHTNDVEIGWHSVGGRACPIGWEDCSQPVYESNCGQYTDHGERGGPGDNFCRTECHHGHQPPDEPELAFGEQYEQYQPDAETLKLAEQAVDARGVSGPGYQTFPHEPPMKDSP